MTISTDLINAPKEFLNLFKAGKRAAQQGNKEKARELFRKAIEIDPYHEQVWLWLASVVDTPDDKRVCFENVLELNATNPTARQQLQKLDDMRLQDMLKSGRTRRSGRARRLLVILVLLAVVAGAVVIALTVL